MLKIMIPENLAEKHTPFSAFSWETQLMSHIENTHGPHTKNPHSDSSYPNIFYRLPTFQLFKVLTYTEV